EDEAYRGHWEVPLLNGTTARGSRPLPIAFPRPRPRTSYSYSTPPRLVPRPTRSPGDFVHRWRRASEWRLCVVRPRHSFMHNKFINILIRYIYDENASPRDFGLSVHKFSSGRKMKRERKKGCARAGAPFNTRRGGATTSRARSAATPSGSPPSFPAARA